jgi:hypothetical protein
VSLVTIAEEATECYAETIGRIPKSNTYRLLPSSVLGTRLGQHGEKHSLVNLDNSPTC